MSEQFFIYLSLVPVLGITAQLVAWWIRIPSILLLLSFGVLLGLWMNPDVLIAEIGGDETLGTKLVLPLVSLAVAVILFEGGLSLRFSELRAAGNPVVRLCTIGALISWGLTSVIAMWVLDMHWRAATLLGAVLVVTGPTVVTPLLRHIRPNRKIGSILKWEGIIIDPIGAILAVLVFERLFHSHVESSHWYDPVVAIAEIAAIGGGLALAATVLLVIMVRRYWIPDYLHGVAFLSAAIGVFALSNTLMHESGLVTVTLMGIFLTNQKFISIEHVVEFKENLGVFLVSCLFIVLGSRLDLGALAGVGWRGVGFVAIMILVVRPLSVFGALLGSKVPWVEQSFLAFLAPRGIVAAAVISVFALEVANATGLDAGIAEDAQKMVPATFMVIVGTVAVYGLAAAPLARRMGLADDNPQGIIFAGADVWIRELALLLQNNGFAVMLVDTNYQNISAAKMAGMRAFCASILSEQVLEETSLTGIGKLFALTRNDAVNAFAAKEYSHHFGTKNVYRLSPPDSGKKERATMGHKSSGRVLLDDEWSEPRLRAAWDAGFRPKMTRLTEEFTFNDFQHQHGEDAVLLMGIDDYSVIHVNTIDNDMVPDKFASVVALIRAKEEESPSA